MKRYLIERNIPKAGAMTGAELCHAAETSNAVITRMAPRVQWQHSYVADDAIFCVYIADGADDVREHARLSGFPANRVIEIPTIIDPMTAVATGS
jgi:hypothetical protein